MKCLSILVLIGLVVAAVAVAFMLGRGSFGGDVTDQLLALIRGEAPTEVVIERVKDVPVEVTREVPKEVIKEEVVEPTLTPTPGLPYGCFVTGTLVLTPTGYIAIEELQKGDTVLSYNHDLQKGVEANFSPLVEANIAAVVSRKVNGMMRVELAGGTTIQVTREHPFYAPDESRYKPIGEFKHGERLGRIGRDDKLETIVVTGIEAVRGEFTVYNLSVESSHHNYVAAGVLVHNKTQTPTRTLHTSSPSLGQYHEGRTLLLNVLEMKPTDELRYSTIDSSDVLRKWRIKPVAAGNELLLMHIKVENHIAVNAVVEIDEQAAVLSDYFDNDYRPISVTDSVIRDQRGQEDATVTLKGGLCSDHPRTLVNAGSTVRWTNGGDIESAIRFDPGVLPGFAVELIKIAPGASISHRFDQPGTFDYQCSSGEGTAQKAQILVEAADSVRETNENDILFLEGPFELGMDTAIDGWMVFEVPKDTKIRDLRWRAGDRIIIRF